MCGAVCRTVLRQQAGLPPRLRSSGGSADGAFPESACHQPLTAPSPSWPPADVYNGGCGSVNPFRMSCAGSGARFEGLAVTVSTSIGLAVSTAKCVCCLLHARVLLCVLGLLCAGCCDGCNAGRAGMLQRPAPPSC